MHPKNNILGFLCTLICLVCVSSATFGQNSTGINNPNPSAKAALDVMSATGVGKQQGILVPRLIASDTNALKTGITASEKGLLFFDTTNNCYWFWNGTKWVALGNSASSNPAWLLSGNDLVAADTGVTGFKYIGTNNAFPLIFGTNGTERMRIGKKGNIGIFGNLSIGNMVPSVSLDLSSRTDAIALPVGTTAQQPAAAFKGMMRFNTTLGYFEGNDGTAWVQLSGGIKGVGSVNTVPYWQSTNTLGASSLTYNGTTYAIGSVASNSILFQLLNPGAEIVTLYGQNSSASGVGVWGYSSNANGLAGVRGVAVGTGKGIYGSTTSSTAIGGYFENTGTGGTALSTGTGNVGIGTSSPASLLSVGSTSQFQVNTTGDIIQIKGVTYAWPSAQAAGTLTNDGTGTLTWSAGSTTGSGAINTLPIWTGTSTLGLSAIKQTAAGVNASVSVGNVIPAAASGKFYVMGDANANAIRGEATTSGANNIGVFGLAGAASTTATGLLGRAIGTSETRGVEANSTGTGANSYAIYATTTGAATNSYGIYSNVTAGTNRYSGVFMGGNVGIARATPASPLEVNGTARFFDATAAEGSVNLFTTVTSGPRIGFSGVTATLNTYMEIGAYGTVNNIDTKARDLRVYSTAISTGLTFLAANGNFGIGINAPTSLLHLSGANAVNTPLAKFASSFGTIDFLTNGSDVLNIKPAGTGGKYMYLTHPSGPIVALGSNGVAGWLGTNSNNDLYHVTNGAVRMTTTAAGNVGIGITAPSGTLHVNGAGNISSVFTSSSTVGTWLSINNSSTGGAWFSIISTGSINGEGAGKLLFTRNASVGSTLGTSITIDHASGNVGFGTTAPAYQIQLGTNSAAKPISPSWTVASDARLKKNIRKYESGLSDLMKINTVWFTYTGEAGMPNETGVGVIAQELQQIAPYMIAPWTFVDKNGKKTEYLGVDNGAMTYMLVNSVQEQQKQLENKVDKAMYEKLKAENEKLKQDYASLKADLEVIKSHLGIGIEAKK